MAIPNKENIRLIFEDLEGRNKISKRNKRKKYHKNLWEKEYGMHS